MNKYYFLILIILFLNNNYLNAQEYSDAEVKTAYTYNFGKFVKWENEKDFDTFRIGVYGNDTAAFFNIKKMAEIRLLKEKPISVLHFTQLKNITRIQILYVSKENNFEIAEIFKKIHGDNTLLVTDQCKEQKSVMINFLSIKEGTIQFEINKKNITDENLTLSPKILLIGGTEIDILELYREKEKELQTEKEKVEQREIEIKKHKEKLQELSEKIEIKNKELNKKQILISEQLEKIEEQENKLTKLLSEIKENQNKLESKIKILKKQETEINNKQEIFNKQKKEIDTQKNVLRSQENTIVNHHNKIENQKTILSKQLVKIKIQRLFLYFFIAFIILISGLVFFIYHGYKIKKETNKKLEEKNVAITNQNILIYQQKEEILTQNDELEIHRNHLEKLIKKRTSELEKAKIKAEESDRLKSAFLANMSHEIRTPMNGILGFAGLLKEPNLTGEKQQEFIRIIEKSGKRMLFTINDIIDISRIESGLIKVANFKTNINKQIEYIYNFFNPDVEAKGMKFSFKNSLSAKEANIYTDKEKVLKILTNLVKNAIKFSDEGSIEFGYEKKGNYIEFFVKDTGIGIPRDRQEAIFERFIQADISDLRAFQGAGLGLSITKAYVEMLGGKIWVESEEENLPTALPDDRHDKTGGSVFYFTIPYNIEREEKNVIIKIKSVD